MKAKTGKKVILWEDNFQRLSAPRVHTRTAA